MVGCGILGCKSRSERKNEEITFHTFPSDSEFKMQWIMATGRQNWQPKKKTKICSIHFNNKSIIRKGKFTTLIPNSVPERYISGTLSNKKINNTTIKKRTSDVLEEISNVQSKKVCLDLKNVIDTTLESDLQTSTSSLIEKEKKHLKTLLQKEKTNEPQAHTTTFFKKSTSDALQKIKKLCLDLRNVIDTTLESDLQTSTSSLIEKEKKHLKTLLQKEKMNEPQAHTTTFFKKSTSDALQKIKNLCLDLRNVIDATLESDLQTSTSSLIEKEKKHLKTLLQKEKTRSTFRLKKLHAVRESKRRLKKKTANFENILLELKCKMKMGTEELDLLTNIDSENADFLKRYLLKDNCPKEYPPSVKKFALCLHFISPKAYMFVRKQFDTCLPYPQTLYRWYKSIDCEPGFTDEAFNAIKLKCRQSGNELCCLSLDEMSIRQHLQWNGKITVGYVNVGHNLDTNNMPLAKDALVFMVTALNDSWKLPVGYFLTNGVNGEQRSSLLQNCVYLLNRCGVRVVSVTFDGCPANFSMVKHLGAQIDDLNNLDPTITIEGQKIVVIPDACHMLKLVRNTLADKKEILNAENKVVSWKYIEKLHFLQEKEGLHLANKLRSAHVQFHRQKMKVRLASQTFSKSVANALLYCKDILAIDDFFDSGATIEFINHFNDLFDIFNSRRISSYGLKKPISTENFAVINSKLQEIEKYIRDLKFVECDLVIKSGRKTGFLGFVICIKAIRIVYDTYINVKNASLKHLCTYKMSQDHLEIFFSAIRSKGGFNNNPTGLQFMSAYRRLLIHGELKNISTGNCIPLESINILKSSALSVCKKISSRKERLLEMTSCLDTDDQVIDTPPEGHDYIGHGEITEFSKEVTIYVAGFIIKAIQKIIKCDTCLHSIVSQEKFPSLIMHKDVGGLHYPSKDVIDICLCTEKYLRNIIKIHGNAYFSKKDSVPKIVCSVLKKYINTKIFDELGEHINEQDPLDNHISLLIKAISFRYLEVRIHFIMTSFSQKSERIRNHHTKLVLFKGQ